jgi:hypothetical protein
VRRNPWHRVPDKPDFVLAEDKKAVRDFNARVGPDHRFFLHVDKLIPEPFVGAKDAPVILLSNNPGFGRGAEFRQDPKFMARMCRNLVHAPSAYPFVYLDPAFDSPNRHWWAKRLKYLVKPLGPFSWKIVARSILNVAFFPYPSQRYGHRSLRLPSQNYTFGLVREAIRRRAVIVSMRSQARWVEAVPELESYPHLFQVRNVQNPTVSCKNCPGFDQVVAAIERAERRRRSGGK